MSKYYEVRKYFFLLIFPVLFAACTQKQDSADEKKIRKKVLAIAENYAFGNLTDAKRTVSKDGITTIGNEQKIYVIDPLKIFIGHIDSDSTNDAIVSLFPFQGNYEVTTEHLIIINTDGKLKLVKSLDSDMRIISIKDGMITAEVPEHSRNTPLFNCPSCWEVVRFQFRQGELVRME